MLLLNWMCGGGGGNSMLIGRSSLPTCTNGTDSYHQPVSQPATPIIVRTWLHEPHKYCTTCYVLKQDSGKLSFSRLSLYMLSSPPSAHEDALTQCFPHIQLDTLFLIGIIITCFESGNTYLVWNEKIEWKLFYFFKWMNPLHLLLSLSIHTIWAITITKSGWKIFCTTYSHPLYLPSPFSTVSFGMAITTKAQRSECRFVLWFLLLSI